MAYRKWICGAVLLTLLLFCLSGCRPSDTKQITCAEVVAAYENAGYEVFHKEKTTEGWAYQCYVTAQADESDDYIFFHFFDDEAAAEEYAKENRWNVVLWLYSLANAKPYWLTTKTYGCIEYEYAENALTQPFEELIN